MPKNSISVFSRKLPTDLIDRFQSGVADEQKNNPIQPKWRNDTMALTAAIVEFCDKNNFSKKK